ncbi:TNFAIP3-interacting protein 2 isoform X2 [Cyclopterus lumpus]|uniref:TNFAIP3-interacting protein 2 isoform X2 n=1 Tax=Cyclopterus lumpus TaxID=8103 RepID=UPI0014871652|nr:TNFAIP3-interacting protein 2 isoform X2 [Cyclopterus lumpus]
MLLFQIQFVCVCACACVCLFVFGESLRAGRAQFDEARKSPRGSSLGNPPRRCGDIIVRRGVDTTDLLRSASRVAGLCRQRLSNAGLLKRRRRRKKKKEANPVCQIYEKPPQKKKTMDHVGSNSNDVKLRSCSTLTTLYHETLQELELLNKQVHVKDNIIADLKARLGRYERICMAVGDNESVVVGPSKSLLESLCKEICKLKQKRKDGEFKASRQTEEIQRLTVQLQEKELELERVRCQPDHEKDREVHRLRADLEEQERAEATRAVLCTSLAEEADQLRSQLGVTVKVCQELLARLETDKKGGGGGGGGVEEDVAQQQNSKEMMESSDMSGMNAQICQLQEENQQLKQRVAYVQRLNCQWQKYDSSREDYIHGLCQRLKETSGPGLVPGLGSISTGLLQQEISRLNDLLEEKMSECARLSEEVEETRRHYKERIQTLEQQVLIYADDFKSERADRERAQGQIQDLKEQIYQLKQQLHKKGASRESREVVPMCRVHIGHRITSRRHKDSSEPLLRTTAELQQQPAVAAIATAAAAATPSPAWSERPDLSELQCPRCLATFSDTDAAEYLNHCEECARI